MKRKITKKDARDLASLFKINLNVIPFEDWLYGLNVELEHGKKFGKITNVTNDNLLLTAKIVIAHLTEYPDYYQRLFKLEAKADKYWKNKVKKDIFL